MKKIGFIDYYISEWHANNYPAWIEDIIRKHSLDMQLAYAYAEKDVSPVDGVTTQQWCEKFGVIQCSTIEELVEKSDYIFILSPDDPQKHLQFAEKVLPARKPTYIDKTFAPDVHTAEKIFALAEKYGTPMYSSSALRFCDEISEFLNCKDASVVLTNGPGKFDNYSIHQIEMIIAILNAVPQKCEVLINGKSRVLHYYLSGGKQAILELVEAHAVPFSFSVVGKELCEYRMAGSHMFENLLEQILLFFQDKKPRVCKEQTLSVIKAISMGEEVLQTYNGCSEEYQK